MVSYRRDTYFKNGRFLCDANLHHLCSVSVTYYDTLCCVGRREKLWICMEYCGGGSMQDIYHGIQNVWFYLAILLLQCLMNTVLPVCYRLYCQFKTY